MEVSWTVAAVLAGDAPHLEAGHRHHAHAAVAFLLTRAKTGPSLLHLSECWPQVTLVTGPVETLLATPPVT